MKQVLQETVKGSLSLVESVDQKSSKYLGKLKGVCADYGNATRNGNFYSRKLWENVFNDPLVKESLDDRVLIGELDHPNDGRLETKATNACIVMTGYEFDDSNKAVVGTFDILPTPSGQVLRSLLDYGCKIGVSSRGEGDVTTVDGINKVDEESYYFVAFDAVVLPAVKKAKPSLSESVQKRESLKSSLSEQIKSSTTKSELDLIKKVVEATNLPDVDSLLESINNKSVELEGTTSSSTLMDDLERSMCQVNELTEENKSLRQEVTNCKSRISRMVESRKRSSERLSRSKKESDKLNGKYTDSVLQLSLSSKKVESLERENKDLSSRIDRLNREIVSYKNSCRRDQSRISSLEESLVKSQKVCTGKDRKISDLELKLKSLKEDHSSEVEVLKSRISESVNKSDIYKKKLDESVRRNQEDLKKYVINQSKTLGVDCSRILESIDQKSSFSKVKKMIDEEVSRSDRYRKLPMTRNDLLESNCKGKIVTSDNLSGEDEQTLNFMEEFFSHN